MLNDFPLLLGTVAAALHVISAPDHLAAITPYAIEKKHSSWLVGLFWGLGHLGGMLLIGVAFLLFKPYIPLEKISEYSETLVGILLVLIGVFIIYKTLFGVQHIHTNPEKEKHHLYSLGIGFLHGLAGVAHFIILLPVLGFDSHFQGILYIVGFGLGSVTAMTLYTLILGKTAQLTNKEGTNSLSKVIRFLSGLFALIVGLYWLYLGVN